jgi:hypothetical protein
MFPLKREQWNTILLVVVALALVGYLIPGKIDCRRQVTGKYVAPSFWRPKYFFVQPPDKIRTLVQVDSAGVFADSAKHVPIWIPIMAPIDTMPGDSIPTINHGGSR